jgi:hypothetical protein|tara:strand:- start:1025 stop:1528 length:504 start_codon:yes stop_codon:yes gene_type:complete
MTYENQTRSDAHGAARSGQQREQMLREFFEDNGFTFMKTKKECEMYGVAYDGTIRHPVPEEYAECGFKYFLTDGYVLELDAVIELKGGDKSGTTEEKVFFDLEKLRDGCYGSCTVLYITEGKKETDKCTKLFTRKLLKSQERGDIAENVHVLPYSQLTQEVLVEVAK